MGSRHKPLQFGSKCSMKIWWFVSKQTTERLLNQKTNWWSICILILVKRIWNLLLLECDFENRVWNSRKLQHIVISNDGIRLFVHSSFLDHDDFQKWQTEVRCLSLVPNKCILFYILHTQAIVIVDLHRYRHMTTSEINEVTKYKRTRDVNSQSALRT